MPTNAKEIKCTCMYMHKLRNLYDFVRECPLSVKGYNAEKDTPHLLILKKNSDINVPY